jgi:hypothetical protein
VDAGEWWAQVRSLLYRGEGRALADFVQPALRPDGPLQLVGDGLLVALSQGVAGATDLAAACAASLRDRGWRGDHELAAHLDAGPAPAPRLRPLPVALDELADVLESDVVHSGGRIDLLTGEIWREGDVEYAETMGEHTSDHRDPERWLVAEHLGPGESHVDMELFVEREADPERAELLADALLGGGARGPEGAVLDRWTDDVDRWHMFSDDRRRGRARAWLASAGYCAAPPERPRFDA